MGFRGEGLTSLPAPLSLRCIYPREPDYQRHNHQEEQELDADRDSHEPPGTARSLPAALAVGGVGDELPTALVARDLNLGHPN
jgi:hypothetical protein